MLQILNPYSLWLDLNGRALDEGYISIGAPGDDPETDPVDVFWDEAGTIAAEQPLRTSVGLIENAGTPARIYGPASYSIRVRDKQGVQVFYTSSANPLDPFALKSALPFNVRDTPFNAKGDGETDDTAAIQAAIDAAKAVSGQVFFPPADVGKYYKTTAPLVCDDTVSILGAGESAVTILAEGLLAGQFVIDLNCEAIDVVEHCYVMGVTLRSDNDLPNGVRARNISFSRMSFRSYGLANALLLTGSRAFSNDFFVEGYDTGNRTIDISSYTGGGDLTFRGSFSGAYGLYVAEDVEITGLTIRANFEQCFTNSLLILGTVYGLDIPQPRTEGCDGDDFVIYPAVGKVVSGLSIHGGLFTAESAASTAITLGGNGGLVNGYAITGNRTLNSSIAQFVKLNGGGDGGLVAGNNFGQAATQAVDAPRPGAVVFGNRNTAGACTEYWGSAAWGVTDGASSALTDGSGAGLGNLGSIRHTKIGRMVFWQAIVVYPATADGSPAIVSGLPLAISGGTSNQGRAGANVSASDVGAAVGVLQGVATTTSFSFVSPTALTNITNATLSGKTLYVGGHYMI